MTDFNHKGTEEERDELENWRSGMAGIFGVYTADPKHTLRGIKGELEKAETAIAAASLRADEARREAIRQRHRAEDWKREAESAQESAKGLSDVYLRSEVALQSARQEIEDLRGALEKAAAFKAYVHKRLDDAGVAVDPESPHKAAGCRIGGRLDWLLGRCNFLSTLSPAPKEEKPEPRHTALADGPCMACEPATPEPTHCLCDTDDSSRCPCPDGPCKSATPEQPDWPRPKAFCVDCDKPPGECQCRAEQAEGKQGPPPVPFRDFIEVVRQRDEARAELEEAKAEQKEFFRDRSEQMKDLFFKLTDARTELEQARAGTTEAARLMSEHARESGRLRGENEVLRVELKIAKSLLGDAEVALRLTHPDDWDTLEQDASKVRSAIRAFLSQTSKGGDRG